MPARQRSELVQQFEFHAERGFDSLAARFARPHDRSVATEPPTGGKRVMRGDADSWPIARCAHRRVPEDQFGALIGSEHTVGSPSLHCFMRLRWPAAAVAMLCPFQSRSLLRPSRCRHATSQSMEPAAPGGPNAAKHIRRATNTAVNPSRVSDPPHHRLFAHRRTGGGGARAGCQPGCISSDE